MYLAFFEGKYGSLVDKIIVLVTGGKYSHVELIFSDGYTYSASLKLKGSKMLPPGTHDVSILNEGWSYVKLPDSLDESKAREFCDSIHGSKYDLFGLLHWFFTLRIFGIKRTESRKKWFCSEAIAHALTLAGDPFPLKAYKIGPDELAIRYK